MSVNDKLSTTFLWVKQLTTITIKSLSRKIFASDFVRRNAKPLLIGVILWLVFILFLSLFYRSSHRALLNSFYESGVVSAINLTNKIGSPLLENDQLALTVAIGELRKKHDIVLAAILDHQGTVVAHTDPGMVNRRMQGLSGCELEATFGAVKVYRCSYLRKTGWVGYSNDITYADIKIGSVFFGVKSEKLDAAISGIRIKAMIALIMGTLAAVFTVLWFDRYLKRRAVLEQEAIERSSQMGPYLLKEKIAQGGMAELFIADHIREDGFRKKVAVKRILSHLSDNEEFIRMFMREARLAALLSHPNIVQIYDFQKIGNSYIIAMEYVDGKNLADIVACFREGLPVDIAIYLIQKISKGLHYSHTRTDDKSGEPLNIVHRDISPQNILISYQGEIKISDFGISKASSEPNLTQVGVIKGKLAYLSPEQVVGQVADSQCDIYALGLVFHEILSGKRVFNFKEDTEAIRIIPTAEIPPLDEVRGDIPSELNKIVMKCLEKEKSVRYQNAKELYDDLQNLKNRLNISYDESALADFMEKTFRPEEKT